MNGLSLYGTGNQHRQGRLALGLLVIVVWGLFLGVGEWLSAQEPTALPAEAPVTVSPPTSGANEGSLPTGMLDMLRSLHYWTIPFGVATFVLVWFSVERMVVLRRGRVIPKPFVQRFIRLIEDGEMEQDEALEICQENDSPIANIFAHAVRKWGKPSVEVEQAVIDGGERQVAQLRSHLRVLNGVHTITPMIGLLGTVWGMLESFNQIAFAGAMGKTDQLASGIALALVTTAVGLLIAIPALVAYLFLSGKVESLVMQMDDLAQRVVQAISAEGLMARASRPKKAAVKGDAEPPRKR
ncbi:MAG: MotA/TolQ/ExbB proton channel family protein [Planctomycetota bacterium]|nr:MAG: MotA/TolQ/ExbB proton channel family protein [Planctomycetota bacterium]